MSQRSSCWARQSCTLASLSDLSTTRTAACGSGLCGLQRPEAAWARRCRGVDERSGRRTAALGRPTTDDRGTGATCWLPGRVEERSPFAGCRARGRSERQSPRLSFSAGASAPRAGGVVISWLEGRECPWDSAPTRSRRTPAGEARAGAAAGRVAPRPLRQLHPRRRPMSTPGSAAPCGPPPWPDLRPCPRHRPRADIPIDDRAEARAEPPSPSAARRPGPQNRSSTAAPGHAPNRPAKREGQPRRPASMRHRGLCHDDAMAGLPDRSTPRPASGPAPPGRRTAARAAEAGKLRQRALRARKPTPRRASHETNPRRGDTSFPRTSGPNAAFCSPRAAPQ